MSKFGKAMIWILIFALAIVLVPVILAVGGVAISVVLSVLVGLGVILLPVIIGVIIGYAAKK